MKKADVQAEVNTSLCIVRLLIEELQDQIGVEDMELINQHIDRAQLLVERLKSSN